MPDSIHIVNASSPDEITDVRQLFEEYAAWLGFSLDYQGFPAELAGLPGLYAPPKGRLLLAYCDNAPAACGALRPQQNDICETKRLFVRPAFRGRKLGFMLANRLIAEARLIGYKFIASIPFPIAWAMRFVSMTHSASTKSLPTTRVRSPERSTSNCNSRRKSPGFGSFKTRGFLFRRKPQCGSLSGFSLLCSAGFPGLSGALRGGAA
jgi:GNAT superfamily N-acetyltransferase